jgi:mono/diheme cytochrome c family protein
MRRRAFFVLCLALAACGDAPFAAPLTLGGRVVPARVLNRGHAVYRHYCQPCHGSDGDGRGYASYGLRPPPRDFTQAQFLFAHVPAPGLPPDEELAAIVRRGLEGSAMRAWDVPDADLDALIQYLKTFSPRWRKELPTPPVAVAPDPFGAASAAAAVERGKRIYHVRAQCSSCHSAFITHQELWAMSRELTGSAPSDFSPQMYEAQLRATEICLRWRDGADHECELPYKLLAPDFTRDALRSVHDESALEDLYRIIAAGISPAGMPSWKGSLPEDDLWALAYYIRSLTQLRGTPGAAALAARLHNPANLTWHH